MNAVLASIRPDSWNFPLFLHVAGAAVFFGAVAVAAVTQLTAARVAEPELLRRVAFRTLLIVGLPAYIVFRVGAEWLHSKEFPSGVEDPTWVGIGYGVSDVGAHRVPDLVDPRRHRREEAEGVARPRRAACSR